MDDQIKYLVHSLLVFRVRAADLEIAAMVTSIGTRGRQQVSKGTLVVQEQESGGRQNGFTKGGSHRKFSKVPGRSLATNYLKRLIS